MGVVLMVRHGQASFGSDDYDVLSETGWAQGRELGAWLAARSVAPTTIVRGSMRRHRETVEAVVTTAGWAGEVDVDAGWDEFDHLGVIAAHPGEHPGNPTAELSRREFQQLFEVSTERWTVGGSDADYPDPWPDFVARVRASFGRACDLAGSGRTVVVVSSGGPVAAVCAALADPDLDTMEADRASYARLWSRFNTVMVNSGVTQVVVGSTGPRLLTFNEHAHLAEGLVTYR